MFYIIVFYVDVITSPYPNLDASLANMCSQTTQ